MNQQDSKRPSAGRAPKALGEFTIIVVGVLAALGVQAMWEGIGDRQREDQYLSQILSDARFNIDVLEDALGVEKGTLDVTISILTALKGTEPIPEDSARAWVESKVFYYADPRIRLGSVSALIGTADFCLIRDPETSSGRCRYEI